MVEKKYKIGDYVEFVDSCGWYKQHFLKGGTIIRKGVKEEYSHPTMHIGNLIARPGYENKAKEYGSISGTVESGTEYFHLISILEPNYEIW